MLGRCFVCAVIVSLCGGWVDHQKNTALEVVLPMVDSATPESYKTGLSPADTAYYKNGAGSWTSLAITDTFAEIGSTGVYEISLAAGECNHDWILIKVTATGAADTMVVYRMFTDDIDSIGTDTGNIETDTQDIQGRLPAALVSGRMSADAVAVSGSTTAADNVEANIGNLDAAVSTRSTVTTAQVNAECDTALSDYDGVVPADLPSNFADLAITASTGRVTVGTSNDKTGYSLAVDQSGVTVGTVNALGAQAKLDVNAEADTALTDYDPPTDAEMDAAIAALNDLDAAAVNAEVDTALADVGLDHLAIRQGTAQVSGAGTIVLDAGASATSGTYDGQIVVIASGTGAGQSQRCDSYNGTSKTCTMSSNWATAPDSDSQFVLYPGRATAELGSLADGGVNAAVDAALDTAITGSPTADSVNERVKALDVLLENGGGGDAASMLSSVNDIRTNRLTATRAGYLDYLPNINTGGLVATAASISALNDVSSADVNAACDTALTDYDGPTDAELTSGLAGLNDPTVAEIWGDALPGAYGVGEAGYLVGTYLDAAVSSRSDFDEAADPVELVTTGGTAGTNADELVDLIWDEDGSDHPTAGTLGKRLYDDIWETHVGPTYYSVGEAGYFLDARVSDGCILPSFPSYFSDLSIAEGTGLVTCSGGGGGGTTITLGPLVAAREPGNRITSPITLEMFEHEDKAFAVTVVDADGDAVDLSALTLRFVVYGEDDPPTSYFDVEEAAIGRNGVNVAIVNVSAAQANFADEDLRWVLRDTATGQVLAHGPFAIVASVADVP